MQYYSKFCFLLALSSVFSVTCFAVETNRYLKNPQIETIQKYQIELPESILQETGGFYTGIGSGLQFSKKLENGNLEFFAISDRGPNFPVKEGEIVLFYPDFSPKIVRIELENNLKAEVKDFLNIKYNGKQITGFNINKSANDEKVFDTSLKPLTLGFGLDTEAIAILKNGNFVVSDEYGPSLNIIDNKTGEILKRLTPGDGLPENFAKKNFNKGIEAITVAPNGKIYALLEGVLNLSKESVKTAQLIRMLEIDLAKNSYRVFAYGFDYNHYQDSSKVKIGDIAAIDNENFLIVEQGATKDGKYRNVIFKINIKDASDIKDIMLDDGKELEFGDLNNLSKIRFVNKKFIFNPRNYGWDQDKLEGIALIDKFTIAVANDNDFSIVGLKIQEDKCADAQEKYCKKVIPVIDQKKLKTDLWVFKFKEAF